MTENKHAGNVPAVLLIARQITDARSPVSWHGTSETFLQSCYGLPPVCWCLAGRCLRGVRRNAAWHGRSRRQNNQYAYQLLWKSQAAGIEKLPVHMRGELLAGLATTAQRTGRVEESGQ